MNNGAVVVGHGLLTIGCTARSVKIFVTVPPLTIGDAALSCIDRGAVHSAGTICVATRLEEAVGDASRSVTIACVLRSTNGCGSKTTISPPLLASQ